MRPSPTNLVDIIAVEAAGCYSSAGRIRDVPTISEGLSARLEELRLKSVELVAGEQLLVVERLVEGFSQLVDNVLEKAGLRGILFPKEFNSFIRNPRRHLAKKLYQYSIDLARGSLDPAGFASKARSAIQTSLATNYRSLYQHWVFLQMISIYADKGGRLVYPDHGYLHLDRQGRQRGGSIPANAVIRLPGAREASFYLEAPRPIGWGDSKDLEKAWSLYTSLRPDMVVYRGRVVDMVEWKGGKPGVRRPSAIIEFKEMPDWYVRTRYLKGPLVDRFTAEEWYSRWFEGLKLGLADILGYRTPDYKPQRRSGVRVREADLVKLYASFYKPEAVILVSMHKIPSQLKSLLEESGVITFDGIGMDDGESVAPLASEVERFFDLVVGSPLDLVENRLWRLGVVAGRDDIERAIAVVALRNLDLLIEMLAGDEEDGVDSQYKGLESETSSAI